MKLPNVCVLVAVVATCLSSGLLAGPAWRLEVVPSRNSEGKGAVIYATKPLDKFYVVLHNVSGKDLRIWRDWSPWGYDNLTFEARLENGKTVTLKAAAKEWGKAYPDAALVRAGKCYVFEIHLAGKVWQGAELLPKTPFLLTAHYAVKETAESREKRVWTGKASSTPMKVSVRQ